MKIKAIRNPIQAELRIERKNPFDEFISNKLILSTHTFTHVITIDQIIYIEAESNYSKIHLSDGRSVLASKTLKYFEFRLSTHPFFRVHASYLINLSQMTGINKKGAGCVLLDRDVEIPISNKYRRIVYNRFKEN